MVHPGDADVMSADAPVMDTIDGLAGTRWKLVELNGKPAEVYDNQPEPPARRTILKARKAGFPVPTAAAIGSYPPRRSRRFSQLGSTMMLCPKGDAQARTLLRRSPEPHPFRIPGTRSICGAAKRGGALQSHGALAKFLERNKSETRLTHKGRNFPQLFRIERPQGLWFLAKAPFGCENVIFLYSKTICCPEHLFR